MRQVVAILNYKIETHCGWIEHDFTGNVFTGEWCTGCARRALIPKVSFRPRFPQPKGFQCECGTSAVHQSARLDQVGAAPIIRSKFQVEWETTVFGVEEHPLQTGCCWVLSFAERRIFDRGFESLPIAACGMVAERLNAPDATPRSPGGVKKKCPNGEDGDFAPEENR